MISYLVTVKNAECYLQKTSILESRSARVTPIKGELVCWWQHSQFRMLDSEERYCQTGGGVDSWKREGSRNHVTGEGAEEQKEDIGGEILSYTCIHITSKIFKER